MWIVERKLPEALNLFLYDRYFVFGKTIDTNTLIKKELYNEADK